MRFESRWVLVTGASSGLGREIARELARREANLIITARREQRLAELREELEAAHGVEVVAIPADLSRAGEAERLALAQLVARRVIIRHADLDSYYALSALARDLPAPPSNAKE